MEYSCWGDCKGGVSRQYNHFPVVVLARHPPVQSDQLCSIGADMTSATSLSLSTFLYGTDQHPTHTELLYTGTGTIIMPEWEGLWRLVYVFSSRQVNYRHGRYWAMFPALCFVFVLDFFPLMLTNFLKIKNLIKIQTKKQCDNVFCIWAFGFHYLFKIWFWWPLFFIKVKSTHKWTLDRHTYVRSCK